MAQQIIDVGNVANDGLGDPLRDAFIKVNDNFTELYAAGGITGIQNGNSNIVIFEDSTINISSGGISNVLVVSETGVEFSGSMTGNVVSVSGNITGSYFSGNGRFLTGVNADAPASAIVGNTLSANVRFSSLSTVGTLANLSVTGNITSGNSVVNGILNVTGTGSFGNSLSVARDISVAGNVVANNITSVNAVTFPSLSLSGNISAGNVNTAYVYSTGNISAAGNVVGNNIVSSTITSTGTLTLNPVGNIDVNNHWINNLSSPTQSSDAATKSYVDSVVSGLNIHPAVNAASTSDLADYTGATVNYNNGSSGIGATLSIVGNTLGLLDGYALSVNDRVLIKNENNAVYNGVYVVNSGTLLTRASDFDTTSESSAGSYVFVNSGNENGGSGWTQTTVNPVFGISNIVFTQFSGGSGYLAGTGLTLTGTTFSITDTAVTAGSYGNASATTSFTVNGQGQLTEASATTVVAPAAFISGNTLSSNVVTSSLTTVGVLSNLSVTGNVRSSTLSASGNVVGGNLNAGGLSLSGNVVSTLRVTANILTGNLSAIGIVTADTLSGVGSIITAANVTGGNVRATSGVFSSAVVSAVGNITGSYFFGNVALANGLPTQYANSNVAAYLPVYGGDILAGVLSTTGNIFGNGIISAAGNIAAGNINIVDSVVGSVVSATANIMGPNVITGFVSSTGNVFAGVVSASGNVTGNYLLGNIAFATGTQPTYGNTEMVANLAALGNNPVSTTGNITAGYYFGNIALANGFPTTYGNANVVANLAALGSNPVSTTGNVNGGNIIASTSVSTNSITHTGTNATGNIGSSSSYFNTFFGTAVYALYADLAENYAGDQNYQPGTVLSFGGDNEVTLSTIDSDLRVAGVVSTHPAQLMNSAIEAEFPVAVALTGRVPVSVVGTVRKGDLMVSAGNGAARSKSNPQLGSVLGKSLENFNGESGIIEIVVGRL